MDAMGVFTSQHYEWARRFRDDGFKGALAWRDGPYGDYSQAPRD